jgi:uncharacterized membrane protein YgcG
MTESEESEGSKGPSKAKVAGLAWGTYGDLKKLMEGDPLGAVGLLGNAGQWAQLLFPEAIATPVIAGGLKVLSLTSLTMGEGSPDGGGAFSDGAKLFQSNGKSLEGAYPTETWSGSASDAYTSQNSHQIQRATTMLEADNDIVRILSTQAQQVDHARTEVDWAAKGLAAVIPVAMALEATVLGAPESIALQLAAVVTASAFAGLAVGNLVNYANHNAAQIQEATDKYRQAGAADTPSGSSSASPSDSCNETGPTTSPNPNDPNEPSTPGNQNGPTSTGNPGSPYGGGSGPGSPYGGGSGPGGSGSGGGSPATPSTPPAPATTGLPIRAGNAATGAGMGATPSPSQMGGMPSPPQMGGGAGSGGAGILGSLIGAAGQAVQAATQAAQQADQQDPNAQDAGGAGDDQPGPDEADDDQPRSDEPGASGGTESPAGRAPIHVSFDAGAAHTELTVDPETVKGPIHVSLDPANPTAPPHITTGA